MPATLDQALVALLKDALPGVFGGTTPLVSLTLLSDRFEVDPDSADATAGAPRPDDRTDTFPFNPETPVYTLTQPPYPSPRRVRLMLAGNDSLALRQDEVQWDPIDSRRFSLTLRPTRNTANVTSVQVLYGVTAIFTTLKLHHQLSLELASTDSSQLDRAEALALATIALNRQMLIDTVRATYENGEYGAVVDIKSLQLLNGTRPNPNSRLLTLRAEAELKASRALRADEGTPIKRIITPGYASSSDRPIDIQINVQA